VASEYLSKGSPVLIEGRLKLDSWETQDGQKRSKLKVVGEKMQMLGGRPQGGAEGGAPRPSARQDSQYSQPSPPDEALEAQSGEPAGGDEIPF
jgi:single-strand DNA-binding protein